MSADTLRVSLDPVTVAAANIAAAGWPIGPRLSPCVCGQPWHTHQHDVLPAGCTGYTGDPADQLAQAAGEALAAQLVDDIGAYDDYQHELRRAARPPGPRVSDVGSCRRQVWYRETPPEDYTPRRVNRRQATIGSAVHDKAAAARAWRYPWRMHELAVSVPGLDGVYRVDEYDPVTGRVIDFKTCGEAKWQITGDDGPTDEQWQQVMIYALALDAMDLPVKDVEIICVRRENGAEESFVRLYDPAVATAALDSLTELADMLELGRTPPRDGGGLSDWRCRYCPAMLHCWNVDAAAQVGRSPESYSVLGAVPDDPTIVWAAGTAHELQKAAARAKAAADEAKRLLEGIPSGEYGGFVVRQVVRPMPVYKETHNRNLNYWLLDPEHRPAYEVVAEPEKRIDRFVTVSRVRAAKRAPKETVDPIHDVA